MVQQVPAPGPQQRYDLDANDESLPLLQDLMQRFGDTCRVTSLSGDHDSVVIHNTDDIRHVLLGNRSNYALSRTGRSRVEEASRQIYAAKPVSWDKQWRVILATGEHSTKEREQLRHALYWQGFGQLNSQSFIHPSADLSSTRQLRSLASSTGTTAPRTKASTVHWARRDGVGTQPPAPGGRGVGVSSAMVLS